MGQIKDLTKWLKIRGPTKWLKIRGPTKWLKVRGPAKWLKVRGSTKWLKIRGPAKWLKVRGSTKWLKVRGSAKWLKVRGPAKLLKIRANQISKGRPTLIDNDIYKTGPPTTFKVLSFACIPFKVEVNIIGKFFTNCVTIFISIKFISIHVYLH